jgi:signal transduction histidine kinase
MGSVIITDRYGVEIYRSAVQYTSPFTARDTIGTDMGDLYAQATLRGAVADQLIIGGLPKSRLPLILGLLGLTAVLIGSALVQLRRESQLTRLRSDFISGVSHELRTPLAQIRMFSETLTLGRVRSDEERRRSLAIIDQEARRLTHLVENLLHFSRSERQTTHITPEPTALAPLVQEVIDGFAPLAAARGATLSASIPEDLVVPADPGAVRQMLLNLLDNAVKYGPAGQQVRIGASMAGPASRAPTASGCGCVSGGWSAIVTRPSRAAASDSRWCVSWRVCITGAPGSMIPSPAPAQARESSSSCRHDRINDGAQADPSDRRQSRPRIRSPE